MNDNISIRDVEEKVKKIFEHHFSEVRYHPATGWYLEVRTKADYMSSKEMDEITALCKGYGLECHSSIQGFFHKKIYLYIYKDGSK